MKHFKTSTFGSSDSTIISVYDFSEERESFLAFKIDGAFKDI